MANLPNRTITVSCGSIKNYDDDIAFSRLQKYCRTMSIGMEAVEMNKRLHLRFTGREDNIMELENYLKEKSDEN